MNESSEPSREGEGSFKRVAENLYRVQGGRYYALVRKGGKQIKRSLRTKDRKLADRRLKDFLAKADRVNMGSEHRSILFEELAKLWLDFIKGDLKPNSLARRKVAVNCLAPYFRGLFVRSLGQAHIQAWKARRESSISPRTWNIEVETLRLLLAYAQDGLRIIVENPAEQLSRKKEVKKVASIPSRTEFSAIIRELRSGHKATGEAADLVEFLAYSGCRVEEAIQARWRDVNFERKTLLITGGDTGTKNHEQRETPLFPALDELLNTMRAKKTPADGSVRIFGIKSARLQLQRVCARLGLPRWGHHTMRHFFCSNALEQTIDFKTIADWVGHKDGGVLVAKTYGHLRREHSDAKAKLMTFRAEA